MTVWVLRGGKLVEKSAIRRASGPYISRMEPFQSPIDGREITSWRQRERDMSASGSVDPRDLGSLSRGRETQAKEAANVRPEQPELPFWRDRPDPNK